ncbi:MAG: UvrD-helicase domain-containing protein, partial [Phototrophicaceae bacterium]
MVDANRQGLTQGENIVYGLLSKLPPKSYLFYYEPQIIMPDGQSRKPDFVVISANLGVIVIEVKDWVKIKGGDQHIIQTIRSDGEPMNHPNPVRTAQGYAYNLRKRFEGRAELWEDHKGCKRLSFPWEVLVVLPNIKQYVIDQFVEKGIWPANVVIGREHLKSATQLHQAFENLPWKFKIKRPLSLDMLDIIRETIDPSLRLDDEQGSPIGTITLPQETLIKESLPSAQPKQLSMLEDDESVSSEITGIAENVNIRLVRGVAGSGKTLVIVKRTKYLVEQYPDARILVLAFNTDLATDLKKRVNASDHIEVTNFHKLCARIIGKQWHSPLNVQDWLKSNEAAAIKQLGLPIDYVAQEIRYRKEIGLDDDNAYLTIDRKGRNQRLDQNRRVLFNDIYRRYRTHQEALQQAGKEWLDWEDVPKLALQILQDHELKASYDAILIDEAQDFAPDWVAVCKMLLKKEGTMLICDDPSQSIFRSYTWIQKGLSVVGRSRVLRVPFRSTREISLVAHSLIEADETLRQFDERPEPDFTSYELGSGTSPLLIQCPDNEAEISWIVAKIHELVDSKIKPQQIAILCHDKNTSRGWKPQRDLGVYVDSFEKMKGLEFDVVFIPQLESAFPDA